MQIGYKNSTVCIDSKKLELYKSFKEDYMKKLSIFLVLFKIRKYLEKEINLILDFLFPPVCVVCGKKNDNWLCDKCENKVKKEFLGEIGVITWKKYYKKRIISKEEKEQTIRYKILYLYKYNGVIRKLILKYKFNHDSYIYHFFSNTILYNEKIRNKLQKYDCIIPVPMTENKRRKRGYNQTELIANEISKELGILNESKNVLKIKKTKVQSKLTAIERKENIKNAFFVNNKEYIKSKKVIVLDDIFTTGETIKEMVRTLESADVKEILVLILAKD